MEIANFFCEWLVAVSDVAKEFWGRGEGFDFVFACSLVIMLIYLVSDWFVISYCKFSWTRDKAEGHMLLGMIVLCMAVGAFFLFFLQRKNPSIVAYLLLVWVLIGWAVYNFACCLIIKMKNYEK